MKSPYDQRTDKTRDRIRGNRKSYYPNKHYRSYGCYKTREEAISELEKNLAEDN